MKKLVETVFWIFLVAFLALGALIVFGQLLGVVLVNPVIVSGAAALFNWSAFTSATICALAAFVLQYLPGEGKATTESGTD
ncbi:hypothetical protein [Saccharopolyspora cebuensis]|uniref:Uncharacterized protein n=1 Tax=Saccharopolyspora cebuensis TaxID=418759 RepID=A0ABV4CQ46_9PSEU